MQGYQRMWEGEGSGQSRRNRWDAPVGRLATGVEAAVCVVADAVLWGMGVRGWTWVKEAVAQGQRVTEQVVGSLSRSWGHRAGRGVRSKA